jgi:hypothetical protein
MGSRHPRPASPSPASAPPPPPPPAPTPQPPPPAIVGYRSQDTPRGRTTETATLVVDTDGQAKFKWEPATINPTYGIDPQGRTIMRTGVSTHVLAPP